MYTAWLIFDQKDVARLIVMDKGAVKAIYDVTSDAGGRFGSARVYDTIFNETRQTWDQNTLWEGLPMGGRALYTVVTPPCDLGDAGYWPIVRRRCASEYYHAFKGPITHKQIKAIRGMVLAESRNIYNKGNQFILYEA